MRGLSASHARTTGCLGGLEEAGGRDREPHLSRDFINRVVAATMEAPRRGSTHWSARRRGAPIRSTTATMLRIWKDHRLQPIRAAPANAPGQIERRCHDYVCHGTTMLFAALDVATAR